MAAGGFWHLTLNKRRSLFPLKTASCAATGSMVRASPRTANIRYFCPVLQPIYLSSSRVEAPDYPAARASFPPPFTPLAASASSALVFRLAESLA